jgi:hypothetical protein
MAKPIRKLTDEEMFDKAERILRKLIKFKALTNYEADIMRMCHNKAIWNKREAVQTRAWAQEAFKEQARLMELLAERWRAGWRGGYESRNNTPGQTGNQEEQSSDDSWAEPDTAE